MTIDERLFAFTNALQPVRRAWVQAARRELAATGLSASLASVVLLTSRLGPGVQQKTLALEIGVNPAALVRLLDQGEAAGLLIRSAIEGDRRCKAIDLLPEGKRRAEEMERSLAALRRDLLGDLPVEDVETATRILRLLEDRVASRAQGERAS